MLLHLGQNVITFRTLLHLGSFITFRPSTAVTKFSYLKELLEKKVRVNVDGLPFNSEGYERAKNILKTKYGKRVRSSTHTCRRFWHYLTSLEVSQRRYMIFTKLLSNVQVLETLGKRDLRVRTNDD